MKARYLATLATAALAPAAFADVDLSVDNGTVVTSTLTVGGEVETFRVYCPAGAALTLRAKSERPGLSLRVRVLHFAQGVVVADDGESVALESVAIPASGQYRVDVSAQQAAAGGDYSLSISWKSRTRFEGGCLFDVGQSGTCEVPFAADAGAAVSFSARNDAGKRAGVSLVSLTAPDGSTTPLAGADRRTTVGATGDHVVTSSADRIVFTSIRVRPPKVVRHRVRLEAQSMSEGHSAVAAALVTPRGGGDVRIDAGPLAGARISVPPATVRGPTTVLVGSSSPIEWADQARNPAGPVVFIGFEGPALRRGRTATVTIPFDAAAFPHGTAGLGVVERPATGVVGEVTGLSIDHARSVVTFQVSRSGAFQVFAPSGALRIGEFRSADQPRSWFFGDSVAIDGDLAVVGDPWRVGADGSRYVGAAHVFRYVDSDWTEVQMLGADPPRSGDWFGTSVAIDGDTIVVGAPGRHGGVDRSGLVFVYARSGDTFVEQAELVPAAGELGASVGTDVAIDGDTVVVGANGNRTSVGWGGTAYVFTRSGTQWSEQQEIASADGAYGDQYGRVVDVSGDRAIVTSTLLRSAYVWVRSGTSWSLEQKLTPPGASEFDSFGWSAAIDGDSVVVGAPQRDRVAYRQGSLFVFLRGASGWTQQQEVVAVDGDEGDLLGVSVALQDDLLVASAGFTGEPGAGAAYVFVRTQAKWTQRARLTAPQAVLGDATGVPVALSNRSILVGAPLGGTGAAYLFFFAP